MRWLVGVLLGALPAQEVTTLPLDERTSVKAVLYQDVSGDGVRDLILAATVRGQDFARTVRVHVANKHGFTQRPDHVAQVPKSVTAFAIGDVHTDPGAEVIWFGGRGAYVWRPRAKDGEREAKLASCEFLFQHPAPRALWSWQAGVRDVDGDGLVDLVLPGPDGFTIAVQRRAEGAASFTTSTLRLPAKIRTATTHDGSPVQGKRSGNRFDLSLRLGGSDLGPTPPLAKVEERVPAPQLHDWDGDGDLDVLALHGERVHIWTQQPAGTFAATPRSLTFPLAEKKTRLDARFSASLIDLDGNRKVDSVLVAKSPKQGELKTQVMFFPQRGGDTPLFNKGVPAQLLILPGFTSAPSFADIDGDGTPDLQMTSWRLDIAKQLTNGGTQSLDIELYAYLNRRGRFPKRPSLQHKATLEGDLLRDGGDRLSARFIGDVTGDKTSDLLVRDRPDRVRLLMVKRRGATLSVREPEIWRLNVSAKALLTHPHGPLDKPAFLLTERGQVLLVRF